MWLANTYSLDIGGVQKMWHWKRGEGNYRRQSRGKVKGEVIKLLRSANVSTKLSLVVTFAAISGSYLISPLSFCLLLPLAVTLSPSPMPDCLYSFIHPGKNQFYLLLLYHHQPSWSPYFEIWREKKHNPGKISKHFGLPERFICSLKK